MNDMTRTPKAKKPTDDEILAALRVLEECGSRGDYAYEKLISQLPKNKRPPASTPLRADLLIVGTGDPYGMSEATMDKIEAAVKVAWKPVTVKIGTKMYAIEFNGIEF
jgi:hypothetical protein